MINSDTTCIIGGYDMISGSFYSEIRKKENNPIFININSKTIKKNGVYNFKIFQLKKIFETLLKHNIKNIIFLGKISRPNLFEFKNDGEIEKYLPILIESFKKGDGRILLTVIKIFRENGFNVLSPKKMGDKFFLKNNNLCNNYKGTDELDIKKSIKILNDLSKYDNAQAIVSVKGHVIAIEAAEGTDELLKRSILIRKNLDNIRTKAGILIKIPKKKQSMLVDLPVIGPKTINLINKANLNGLALNSKYTMVYNKLEVLRLVKKFKLKIYDLS